MIVLTVLAVRRSGESGMKGALWGVELVLGTVLLVSLLFERVLTRDLAGERRAIEARAAELVSHAIAPGSALTCPDAAVVSRSRAPSRRRCSPTPEAVASAVAYVEARYSLLVASAALAARRSELSADRRTLRRGIRMTAGLVRPGIFHAELQHAGLRGLSGLARQQTILADMKATSLRLTFRPTGLLAPGGAASALRRRHRPRLRTTVFRMGLLPAASEVGMMPARLVIRRDGPAAL